MERDIDMGQTIEEAARIERGRIILELHANYKIHGDARHYIISSAVIGKYGVNLFKAGAEWQAKQSPWNNTTEKPVQGKPCLVEYKDPDGEIKVRLDRHCGMEWKEMCHYDKILRWAYVEDLLRK